MNVMVFVARGGTLDVSREPLAVRRVGLGPVGLWLVGGWVGWLPGRPGGLPHWCAKRWGRGEGSGRSRPIFGPSQAHERPRERSFARGRVGLGLRWWSLGLRPGPVLSREAWSGWRRGMDRLTYGVFGEHGQSGRAGGEQVWRPAPGGRAGVSGFVLPVGDWVCLVFFD